GSIVDGGVVALRSRAEHRTDQRAADDPKSNRIRGMCLTGNGKSAGRRQCDRGSTEGGIAEDPLHRTSPFRLPSCSKLPADPGVPLTVSQSHTLLQEP